MLSPSWTAPRNWPCVVLAITVFSGFACSCSAGSINAPPNADIPRRNPRRSSLPVSVELAPCIYAFLSCCNVSSLCPTVPLYLCAPALFSGSFLRRLCVQRLFGHSLSYQEVNLRLALQFAQPLKL